MVKVLLKVFRDPVWGGIAAVVTILALLVSLYLARRVDTPSITDIKSSTIEIDKIIPSQTTVAAGESITISAIILNPNDVPLEYIWSAKEGEVPSGNPGPVIVYTAPFNPSEGIDTITLVVTNNKIGTSEEESVDISVRSQR